MNFYAGDFSCDSRNLLLIYFREQHSIGTGVRSQKQQSLQSSVVHSQPMRSLTTDALRTAYHQTSSDNNSDRDSRSTSSQSQCGHHPRRGSTDSNKKRISYISSNDNHMNIPLPLEYHHQVNDGFDYIITL